MFTLLFIYIYYTRGNPCILCWAPCPSLVFSHASASPLIAQSKNLQNPPYCVKPTRLRRVRHWEVPKNVCETVSQWPFLVLALYKWLDFKFELFYLCFSNSLFIISREKHQLYTIIIFFISNSTRFQVGTLNIPHLVTSCSQSKCIFKMSKNIAH